MTLLPLASFSCVLLAVPNIAAAECDPDNPALCAQAVTKGQPVPFDGQLLTVPLAIKLSQKADRCDQVTTLEVDFAKKLAGVDLALERQLSAADTAAHARELKAMEAAMEEAKEAASVPFYERPWFVGTVTGILVVGGFTFAVWGAGQLR